MFELACELGLISRMLRNCESFIFYISKEANLGMGFIVDSAAVEKDAKIVYSCKNVCLLMVAYTDLKSTLYFIA